MLLLLATNSDRESEEKFVPDALLLMDRKRKRMDDDVV